MTFLAIFGHFWAMHNVLKDLGGFRAFLPFLHLRCQFKDHTRLSVMVRNSKLVSKCTSGQYLSSNIYFYGYILTSGGTSGRQSQQKMWKSQVFLCLKAFQGFWAVHWKKHMWTKIGRKIRFLVLKSKKFSDTPPRGPFELFKSRRNKLQTSRGAQTDLHNFCNDFLEKSCF